MTFMARLVLINHITGKDRGLCVPGRIQNRPVEWRAHPLLGFRSVLPEQHQHGDLGRDLLGYFSLDMGSVGRIIKLSMTTLKKTSCLSVFSHEAPDVAGLGSCIVALA